MFDGHHIHYEIDTACCCCCCCQRSLVGRWWLHQAWSKRPILLLLTRPGPDDNTTTMLAVGLLVLPIIGVQHPNASSSTTKVFSFLSLTHELAVVFYRDFMRKVWSTAAIYGTDSRVAERKE
jgi:hypothetical protein